MGAADQIHAGVGGHNSGADINGRSRRKRRSASAAGDVSRETLPV